MDRKGQLANVAFGGAWSEQIAGDEALAEAMRQIETAAREGSDRDVRHDSAVHAALKRLATAHPKGDQLITAWDQAAEIGNPGLRTAELMRITAILRAGIGLRLQA